MTLLWLFALLGLLGWALAQTLVPFTLEWLKKCPAQGRSQPRRILLVAALPWLVPMTAALAMALLASAKSLGWVHDHCTLHAPHHPHFCFEHLPEMLLAHGHWHVAITAAALSLFALLCLRHGYRHRRQSTRLCALMALSRGKGVLRVLDDSRLMAFAAGGPAPHIYLSQGLLGELTPRERRMVIAHEAAHIRYRDLQAGALLDTLLLLHFKPFAQALRHLWHEAIELRADERVARRFGKTATAELLLRFAQGTHAAPVPTAFGGGNLTLRIQTLLKTDTPSGRDTPVFEVVIAIFLVALLAGLSANHHTLETLIGLVVRL